MNKYVINVSPELALGIFAVILVFVAALYSIPLWVAAFLKIKTNGISRFRVFSVFGRGFYSAGFPLLSFYANALGVRFIKESLYRYENIKINKIDSRICIISISCDGFYMTLHLSKRSFPSFCQKLLQHIGS